MHRFLPPAPPLLLRGTASGVDPTATGATMGPRKKRRQSASKHQTQPQRTEETDGGEPEANNHDAHAQQTEQADGAVAMDTLAEQQTGEAHQPQHDSSNAQHSDQHSNVKSEQTDTARAEDEDEADEQPHSQLDDDGHEELEKGEGEDESNRAEDEEGEDEAEHNEEDDEEEEDDGDEDEQQPQEAVVLEETNGRRPMRAVRQKAEEEAAEKKRKRKRRKRRADGTFSTDEEDEAQEPPKQRRRRRSAAADNDDDDEDGDEREAQAAVQWVQCEVCSKWRKAPAGIDTTSLPDHWHCALNTWDASHASCDASEEVQQEEETIWPGLPRHFLNSREREDFYFTITRPPFDSAHAPPYPTVQQQPIDLYALYAHVMLHLPYQTSLEYWAPLAEQMELKPTEKCWKLLRRAYRRYVKAKVESEREVDAGDDKDEDTTEGAALVVGGASEGESKKRRVYWTAEEDTHLRQAIDQYGIGRWTFIAASVKELSRHSAQEIRNRWRGFTRNRKMKLKVVSDETLREVLANESERVEMGAKSADAARTSGGGKRPYPANVMELDEHRRYSALGRTPRVATTTREENEAKQPEPPADAESVKAEVENAASEGEAVHSAVKPEDTEEQRVQRFYRKHRHVSARISPTVALPLSSLRRYLCDVLHMQADTALRLMKDMVEEADEDERRRVLSEAIYAQLLADEKRSAWTSEMDRYCTQTLRKDRRVRWSNQLAAYQHSLQTTAPFEPATAAEPMSDIRDPTPSPALDSAVIPAAVPLAPLQLATPVRKQYRLPAAAFTTPTPAAASIDFAHAVSAAPQMALPLPPPESLVMTPVVPVAPVRPRTYTLPSVPGVSFIDQPTPTLNASLLPAVSVKVETSPAHTTKSNSPASIASRSPAALAARIQRPPPLPSYIPSPVNSASPSPSALSSPATSASNRRGNQHRGPYFTSRKRIALSTARDAMLALIRTNTLLPQPGASGPIDDRSEWTDYDRAIAEAVAPGNVEDFTPAGVKLSAVLRLVDESVLEDQKKRVERSKHTQHTPKSRENESEEQQAGDGDGDGEEEVGGGQLSMPSPLVAESTGEGHQQEYGSM